MYILQPQPWTGSLREPSWLRPAEPSLPSRYRHIRSITLQNSTSVVLAEDTLAQTKVVIKTYRRTPSSWRRLETAVEAFKQTGTHPHIAGLVAVHESTTSVVTVEEYLPDGDLADRIEAAIFKKGSGPDVTTDLALQWGRHILAALQHMHSNGLVHRDVKPENCALVNDRVKLIDFGLAARAADVRFQGRLGTVSYNAPEVYGHYPGLQIDWCAADVWSLGVTLLVLLTLRLPWEAPCATDSNYKMVFGMANGMDEPSPEMKSAEARAKQWGTLYDLPEKATWLLANLLCPDPTQRWTAAQAMEYVDEQWPCTQ
eukprot:comp21380_c0_seq1/m.29406 comp21380_c0_seq1/g.29406  ORF comp21380_c0_seq1/g.29406 comp21380_c0_seq1/m.29406 type:complete len:314 (-) comp21380_c0_seq1:622-1563(-)